MTSITQSRELFFYRIHTRKPKLEMGEGNLLMTEMEFSPRTKGRKIRTMDSALDLKNLEKELTTLVAEDDLYWLRNDQKLRAIGNTKSYEEFDALVKESTQHLFFSDTSNFS